MMAELLRKEPTISIGTPEKEADSAWNGVQISREMPTAPTGSLTRKLRQKRAQPLLSSLQQRLKLTPETFEALSTTLFETGDEILSEDNITFTLDTLFDFEAIESGRLKPIILVGASNEARCQAAIALSHRLQSMGRTIAFYSLDHKQYVETSASYHAGLDILNVYTAEDCIEAVGAADFGDLCIVEASCLTAGQECAESYDMLSRGLNAEVIYVHDGSRDALAPNVREAGISRMIVAGRLNHMTVGPILDAAYKNAWAFAGHCSPRGIAYNMTARNLAERVAQGLA